MKRTLFLIFLIVSMAAIVESAQIKVKQSAFTPANAIWYDQPQVVMNTRTGESLVYWYKEPPAGSSSPSVVARFINSKGAPISKEFKLPDDGRVIGYNPTTNEYLAAYVGPDNSLVDNGLGIYAQRLNEKLIPIGTAILISSDPEMAQWEQGTNHVVFNPKNGGYTVLFGVHRVNDIAKDSTDVGVVLTNKGDPVGQVKTVIPWPTSVTYPCFLPSKQKLLIAWRDVYSGREETDFWLQSVDALLNNIKPSSFGTKINSVPVKVDQNQFGSNPDHLGAVAPSNISFPTAQVGVVYYPDNGNTKGRRINAEGKFSGAPFVAFNPPKATTKLQLPSAAFTMTPKGAMGILIGLQGSLQDGNSLWAQVMDQNGKPIGTPVEVLKKSENEAVILGNLRAMPSNPSDTSFRFIWFGTVAQRKNMFGGFKSGRILKLTLDLTP